MAFVLFQAWSIPVVSCGIAISIVIFYVYARNSVRGLARKTNYGSKAVVPSQKTSTLDAYPPVTPLPMLEWASTPPIKLRPFKPLYHLTMAIQPSSVSEFIEMDSTYRSRVQHRKTLMTEHGNTVLAAEPVSKPAVDEFYSWIVGTYLPVRFPKMFALERRMASDVGETASVLRSLVTADLVPLMPPESPLEALKILGGLIDEDLLFLVPSEDGDGYVLKAFVNCYPSGFNPSKKLNLKLRDIHGPVPAYKQKLEKSMDRYFDRLEVGKFVKRANWTITTDGQLMNIGGNHLYVGEEVQDEHIDISKTRLRCERQILHRLPKTKALLFSFSTYTYPLDDIKQEGLGEDLATAIEGLHKGSVPDFHHYKRAVVWGEAVKAYLRA